MNIPTDFLTWMIVAILLLPVLYLSMLTVAAVVRQAGSRKSPAEQPVNRKRIAVMIPAHDEETLLPETLRAISLASRRHADVDTWVIADNCTDRTADIARAAGARVAERNDQASGQGKPFALRWFFQTYRKCLHPYDWITLIDADTLVQTDYFNELVKGTQQSEASVFQAYYGTSNLEEGWRPAFSEIAFAVSHHLRCLGRNALGSTAGLKGNGMIFKAPDLLERGWESSSLVEDLEQSILLLERGEKVQYLPAAVVRAEMVSSRAAATNQRKRWEGGRRALITAFGPRLFRLLPSRNIVAAADTLLDLVTPPLASQVISLTIGIVILSLLGQLTPALILLAGLLALVLMTTLSMVMTRVPWICWKALASAPVFLLWKVSLIIGRLFGKKESSSWDRTARNADSQGGQEQSTRRSRFFRRISLMRTLIRITPATKRLMDVTGSLLALVLLSPVLLITAACILLEDRGPVFFKQVRVGKNGKRFLMWKFRSMYTNAEARKAQLQARNEHGDQGVTFKMRNDPRITGTGRIIRKFSIDELPQFVNVLRGEMSLIGPRPPIPAEVAKYKSVQLRRLKVKPGLSCLWQISGRAEIDFVGQVKLDLEYIHTAHLLKDLLILIRTIPAVVAGRGAY